MSKEKHLELIQGVINRMASNSFMLKGWSVVLVSALFALAASQTKVHFVCLAIFPAAAFWVLDWVFSGSFPRGVYFPLMASPGVLFVVYGLWKRAGANDGHRELRETAGTEATKDAKGSTDMEKG